MRFQVIMNSRSKSNGSTKDAQNYEISGNKLYCSGCKTQVKLMLIYVKPEDIS
jgi:hypothetical protein